MTKFGSYWTSVESANPHPTCRKGGCGIEAAEGSEWCVEHDVAVKVNQAWAEQERHSVTREKRTEAKSTFGHDSAPLAG